MKGPLNPSEPMFPVRPNEPVCQYYMKHGTCKFGQACKFNHPAPNTLQHHASVPRFNQPMMMQKDSGEMAGYEPPGMLPQRPEEPNCIYFLKNGRCKYGSTCRYHHPLNYHSRRLPPNDVRRMHPMNDSGVGQPKLHYVSLPPGTYQQGQFVVADGQLAFLSLDGSHQGQVISIGNGMNQEVPVVFTTTSSGSKHSLSRDLGSNTSSTSIASSFESSMIGSGASLNTFNVPDQQGGRAAHVVHSGNRQMLQQNQDGSSSLPQVVSTGSSLDGSNNSNTNNNNNSNNHAYFDARRQTQSPARSEGSNTAYRGQRSSSFDHSRSSSARQHMGGMHESASVPSFSYHDDGYQQYEPQQQQQRGPQIMRGPPPTQARGRQKRQSNGAVDDGLSMMTSALLTMLDTPEEVEGEHYQEFDEYPDEYPESSTPIIANRFASRPQHAQLQGNSNNFNMNAPLYVPQARKAYYDHEQDKPVGMPGYNYDGEEDGYGIPRGHRSMEHARTYERDDDDQDYGIPRQHRSMEHMAQRWSPSMQRSDHQQTPSNHHHHQSINQRGPAFEPRNNGSYFP